MGRDWQKSSLRPDWEILADERGRRGVGAGARAKEEGPSSPLVRSSFLFSPYIYKDRLTDTHPHPLYTIPSGPRVNIPAENGEVPGTGARGVKENKARGSVARARGVVVPGEEGTWCKAVHPGRSGRGLDPLPGRSSLRRLPIGKTERAAALAKRPRGSWPWCPDLSH